MEKLKSSTTATPLDPHPLKKKGDGVGGGGGGGSEELTEIMPKNNSNTAKFGIMLACPSAAGQSHEKNKHFAYDVGHVSS